MASCTTNGNFSNNPKAEISALLCNIPSIWRDAIVEALTCALSEVLHVDADVTCEGVKDCESVTQFMTTIVDNILTATYVSERNITTIRNTDLTDAINHALDEVDPKCLMTQEAWDALTYQDRLNAVFDKVCCVHGDCAGNGGDGTGCGCVDCGDGDNPEDCIGLTACPCVTYEVIGTAPYSFTYKNCETKLITDFESIEDNISYVCAIRGTLSLPEDVISNEISATCSDIPATTTTSTTTTTTETTTTTSTTTTTTSSTTTTTTIPPPTTTTTTTSTTTTTTLIVPPPTTTTTTTTSTTTTTTASGVAITDGVYSNNLGTHCAQPVNTIYTDDGTIFPGKTIYLDAALTNPLTGFTFISDDSVTVVYNLNSANGVVGSNTGMSC